MQCDTKSCLKCASSLCMQRSAVSRFELGGAPSSSSDRSSVLPMCLSVLSHSVQSGFVVSSRVVVVDGVVDVAPG